MTRSPFENAIALVAAWLAESPAAAERDLRVPIERGAAWELKLGDSSLAISRLRLTLPPDFPASPCELHTDATLCLKVPHVEEDGKVCLGSDVLPQDYEDPVAAVARAFKKFQVDLQAKASDPQWVATQFNDEAMSYWSRHCDACRHARGAKPAPKFTYVVAPTAPDETDEPATLPWSEGSIAAYIPKASKHRRFSLQVAVPDGQEADELAQRHRWAIGTLVRGKCLFVTIPLDRLWTPATWPKTFTQLVNLVDDLTDGSLSLVNWFKSAGWTQDSSKSGKRRQRVKKRDEAEPPPKGPDPRLVVLVQGDVLYGYQVQVAPLPLLMEPSIEPLKLIRVDAEWCLTRGHEKPTFRARAGRRILVIGAGSLGSPIIELLARSGVGHMDIIDAELMEEGNPARHTLGISELRVSKAEALAVRLRAAIPGLSIKGHRADAGEWVIKHCVPGAYDLVIECTGESAMRTLVSHLRTQFLGDCPVVHAWVEHFCAAAHVVLSQPDTPWPADDPADALVNATEPTDVTSRVKLPACGTGFHPYGAADIVQAAGFAAERVISVLDKLTTSSVVWSWVRAKPFFEALPVTYALRPIVPTGTSKFDAVSMTRRLRELLATGQTLAAA